MSTKIVILFGVSVLCWTASFFGGRLVPTQSSTEDLQMLQLRARKKELAAYLKDKDKITGRFSDLKQSLWSDKEIAGLPVPEGWSFVRKEGGESPQGTPGSGVKIEVYELRKESAQFRDYSRFIAFLRALEAKPTTQYESVLVEVAYDGRHFKFISVVAALPTKE